jgi:hypothetical protein
MTIPTQPKYICTAKNGLRLCQVPSLSSETRGSILEGEIVEAAWETYAESTAWLSIKTIDNFVGWAAANWLLPVCEDSTEPPEASGYPPAISPTHKVSTNRPNGVKLRAWPNGSERTMLHDGHLVEDLHQGRSNNVLVRTVIAGKVLAMGYVLEDDLVTI